MLDKNLAELYNVETKRLKEQVRRNIKRFPKDFMFELTEKEFLYLRSHIATSNRGGTRYKPMVFTEQGVAMLSSVLNSEKAIYVNIQITKTLIKLRQWILSNKDLKEKIIELEKKYDQQFKIVFDVIKKLLEPEIKFKNNKRKIGFDYE